MRDPVTTGPRQTDRVLLDAIAGHTERLAGQPLDVLLDLRRRLRYLDADVEAAITQRMCEQPHQPTIADRLLDVREAARRLDVCTDYVYRHAAGWSFTVRNGRKLGFSEHGLTEYLRGRQEQPLDSR